MAEQWKSKHFTQTDLERSSTAIRLGIVNLIDEAQLPFWRRAVEQGLEPIRELIKSPIIITGAYRSPELAKKIPGSSKTSLHCGRYFDKPTHVYFNGCAFDLECPEKGNKELWNLFVRVIKATREVHPSMLTKNWIVPEEVIFEYSDPGDIDCPAWVHVGFVDYPDHRQPHRELLRTRKETDDHGKQSNLIEIFEREV